MLGNKFELETDHKLLRFILKPQNRRHALSNGFYVSSRMILMLHINQVVRTLLMLYRN